MSKKTAWVLGSIDGVRELELLKSVLLNQNIELVSVAPKDIKPIIDPNKKRSILVKDEWLDLPAFVLPSITEANTEQYFYLLEFLESRGVRLFNSTKAMNYCYDKFKTFLKLSNSGLNFPKTLLITPSTDVSTLIEEIGLPIVIKPKKGSKGIGVVLIKTESELKNQMEFITCYAPEGEFIAQTFVPGTNGEDIRVLVVDSEPVACMKRSSIDGFRSNFSQGGKVEAYPVNDQIRDITKKICRALDLNIGGIDLFEQGAGEYVLCEVNSSPGFVGLQQTQSFNIPEKLVKYALTLIED